MRDTRHLNFANSLHGIVQLNLAEGPIFSECKPGYCVADDPHILKTLTLDVKSKGLNLEDRVMLYSIIFRIYYKLLHTNLAPRALEVSPQGQTMLMEVNLHKSSVTVPKLLQWDEITRNSTSSLEGAAKPFRRQPAVARIEEYSDGLVNMYFEEEPQSKVKEFIQSRQSTFNSRPKRPRTQVERYASLRCKSVDFKRSTQIFIMRGRKDLFLLLRLIWKPVPTGNSKSTL